MLYICDDKINLFLDLDRSKADDLNNDILSNYFLLPSFVVLQRNNAFIRKRLTVENYNFIKKYMKYVKFVDVMPTNESTNYNEICDNIKNLINDGKINHRIRLSPKFLETTALGNTCKRLESLLPKSSFWVNISRFYYPGYRWHTDQVNLENDLEQDYLVEDSTLNICLGNYSNSYAELELDGILNSSNHRDKIIFFNPKKFVHRIVVEKDFRDVMEFRSFNVTTHDLYNALIPYGAILQAPKNRNER